MTVCGTPTYVAPEILAEQTGYGTRVDVWAAGEASAALGFEAARVFDWLDPLERQRVELLEQVLDEGANRINAATV